MTDKRFTDRTPGPWEICPLCDRASERRLAAQITGLLAEIERLRAPTPILHGTTCTFCDQSFDPDSGDAVAIYRTYWYHEACLLAGLDAVNEGQQCYALDVPRGEVT